MFRIWTGVTGTAIIRDVPLIARLDDGAFQGEPRVSAFGLRPGNHVDIGVSSCGGRCVGPHHQNRQTRLAAEFHFVSHPCVQRALAHDEQHDLGDFQADLQAERCRREGIECRIAPAVAVPGHQNAVAALATDPEPAFDKLRNDHHTARGLKQLCRIAEFCVVTGLVEYAVALSHKFNLVGCRCCQG